MIAHGSPALMIVVIRAGMNKESSVGIPCYLFAYVRIIRIKALKRSGDILNYRLFILDENIESILESLPPITSV